MLSTLAFRKEIWGNLANRAGKKPFFFVNLDNTQKLKNRNMKEIVSFFFFKTTI